MLTNGVSSSLLSVICGRLIVVAWLFEPKLRNILAVDVSSAPFHVAKQDRHTNPQSHLYEHTLRELTLIPYAVVAHRYKSTSVRAMPSTRDEQNIDQPGGKYVSSHSVKASTNPSNNTLNDVRKASDFGGASACHVGAPPAPVDFSLLCPLISTSRDGVNLSSSVATVALSFVGTLVVLSAEIAVFAADLSLRWPANSPNAGHPTK